MGHREHVLVVDDMDDQRKLAASILTSLGYHVSTATNGEQAFELVRDHIFDLVLLDMIMDQGIDGLETFRRMRDLRPEQRAVIASGFAENHRVAQAISLGAHGFLQKPYSLQRIAVSIREALNAPDSICKSPAN
jgi:DNA-binding NtrC family response regulator